MWSQCTGGARQASKDVKPSYQESPESSETTENVVRWKCATAGISNRRPAFGATPPNLSWCSNSSMEGSLPYTAEDWGCEQRSGHAWHTEEGAHVSQNMLKRWNTAKDRAYFAAEGGMEEEAEEEDIPE